MIVFVIAMESELSAVIADMNITSATEVHGRKIYRGALYGEEICVVVCGVGKVNAAAGTQYAIDCLDASAVVNIGVAGGLNGGTRVGNIYAIGECVQYDFDLAMINGTPVGTLNEYTQPYLPLSAAEGFEIKRLATGDRFNDDEDDFLLLTRTLFADIRDMECGAIAHVCAHANVPLYSFKAISDVAGSGSTGEQYSQNLSLCAQKIRENMRKIIESVKGACARGGEI